MIRVDGYTSGLRLLSVRLAEASSEARKATAIATSSGLPKRFAGIC
jgi:hypothetical protein